MAKQKRTLVHLETKNRGSLSFHMSKDKKKAKEQEAALAKFAKAFPDVMVMSEE